MTQVRRLLQQAFTHWLSPQSSLYLLEGVILHLLFYFSISYTQVSKGGSANRYA